MYISLATENRSYLNIMLILQFVVLNVTNYLAFFLSLFFYPFSFFFFLSQKESNGSTNVLFKFRGGSNLIEICRKMEEN